MESAPTPNWRFRVKHLLRLPAKPYHQAHIRPGARATKGSGEAHMEALDFHVAVYATGGNQVTTIRTASGTGTTVERPLVTDHPRARVLLERVAESVTLSYVFPDLADAQECPVRELGELLFASLFDNRAQALLQATKDQAEREQRRMRVVLDVQSAGLGRLPWEFLYDADAGEYLALEYPLVRDLQLMTQQRPLIVTAPLRVLGMVALPADRARLSDAEERQHLHDALGGLLGKGLVELTWVPGQSWRDLRHALSVVQPHVLHFIGHGGFDPRTGSGTLSFVSGDTGQSHHLAASDFSLMFRDRPSLRLVVLNACRTGHADPRDQFSSVAASLLRKEVPAVAAMQFPIRDRAALEFSRSFYGELADNQPVDHSVTSARRAMRIELKGSLEWGTPVVYLRSSSGRIFDIAPPSVSVPEAARAPRAVPEPAPGRVPEEPGAQAAGGRYDRSAPEGTSEHSTTRGRIDLARPGHQPRRPRGFRQIRSLKSPYAVHSVSLGPGGQLLAISGESRTVRLVDVFRGRDVHTIVCDWLSSGVRIAALSPDSTLLATSSRRSVRIWTTAGGGERTAIDLGRDVLTSPRRIAFSPDGKLIATAGWTGAALWNTGDGRPAHRLPVPAPVTDLSFSPSGRQLATVDKEGRCLLWDTRGRHTPVRTFASPGPLSAVSFSPDGRHLVVAGAEGCARIRALPDGAEVHQVPHHGPLNAATFSPDGRRLATGGADGRACVWTLGPGAECERPWVIRHDGPVMSVAFSPDGLFAATGSTDRSVQVWDLQEETDD